MSHAELTCPLCQHPLSEALHCRHCGVDFKLVPEFLGSIRTKLFFLGGALVIGSITSQLHHFLGIEAWLSLRLALDVMVALAYYLVSSYVFSLSQYVEAKPIPQSLTCISRRKSAQVVRRKSA
jgi:hypothetical protein